MPTHKRVNVLKDARWIAEESLLFASDDSPFHARVTGTRGKLVVVTGENVSGKSLFVRLLAHRAREAGALAVMLSIRERTGMGGGGGMAQAFMFGDESSQSTGATSAKVIAHAFEHNLARPQGCILILDEPEMGLSQGYSRALGEYIGAQVPTMPRQCSGVVVVTHSRPLVEGLRTGFGATPAHVSVGAQHDLTSWLADPEERTVAELLALREVGHERFLWASRQSRAR